MGPGGWVGGSVAGGSVGGSVGGGSVGAGSVGGLVGGRSVGIMIGVLVRMMGAVVAVDGGSGVEVRVAGPGAFVRGVHVGINVRVGVGVRVTVGVAVGMVGVRVGVSEAVGVGAVEVGNGPRRDRAVRARAVLVLSTSYCACAFRGERLKPTM